jgi:hypothetical protein
VIFDVFTFFIFFEYPTVTVAFDDSLVVCAADEGHDGIPFVIGLHDYIVSPVSKLAGSSRFEFPVQLLYDIGTKTHKDFNTNGVQRKKRLIAETLYMVVSISFKVLF